jgi:hypothetical protein
MVKKTRSPTKRPSSPNPRPKQRNRQTSVDRFFKLKPSTQAKINEAMNLNEATASSESENESNNPYDVLRENEEEDEADEEEVSTDVDQNETEDVSMSINSDRPSEPSESDYESANDSLSRVNMSKTEAEQNLMVNQETEDPASPSREEKKVPTPLSKESSDLPDGRYQTPTESPDSKPHARSSIRDRSPSRDMETNVNDITPSVLDDLLYEARQHDSMLIGTIGKPISLPAETETDTASNLQQRKPAPRSAPQLSVGGRGRGGRMPSRMPNTASMPKTHPLPAAQSSHSQALPLKPAGSTDTDTVMPDAQPEKKYEPDFSFTRPTYSDPIPPSPSRKYFFRCTWRVDIPKNAPPEEGLRDAILEIWSALRDVDRRLLIYPWHQSAHGRYKALSDTSKFPKKKDTLIRYFKDAYFRPHAGPMYIRVYIGSDLTDEELGKQTSGFFNSQRNRSRIGFWKNPLPFEDTVEIGWLFHSTPGMSATTIQDEIFRHCGIKTALRWKIIATEMKGTLPKALQIRAYHVSVRREDMAAAKFVLTRKIFAKHRRSHFIGGSPMRLIPIMKDVSPNHKQKCIYYIALQSSFLNKIDSMESWEIINLNSAAVGLNGTSLRRLILEIPLRDEPSRQAFLSVDRAFNSASTKFYFFKSNASECRSRITTLLPYLVFTNQSKEKGIKSCFSGEANERAKGVKWDAERMEVMTADDEIMDMYHIYDADDDQDLADDFARKVLLEFAEVEGTHFSSKPAARATKVQEKDASSLFSRSTIASKKHSEDTAQSQNSDMSEDDHENDSDDTPRTVNKTLSTADTVGLSSLSTNDMQTKLELMAQAITKVIPNTPENQAFLAQFSAAFSSSPRVGSPFDSQNPGAPAPGQRL